MAKPAPRTLNVVRTKYITPQMYRVTLGGTGLLDFPKDQESAYIKLIFPQDHGARPLMRTYTISGQREDEIDVDFALHDAEGPASMWARNAQVGEQILVGGPGPDRKSTRLNSSHVKSSYAAFCLKKKTPAFPWRRGQCW